MSTVKFNNTNAVFYNTLKSKIDNYFKEKNIHSTGDIRLYIKSVVITLSMALFYIWVVFFTPQSILLSLLLCGGVGICMSLMGFNMMHDGGHGSYSQSKKLNRVMAYTINFLGANAFIWNQKHNINHHTYPNVEGMDDDIDLKPFLRVHDKQKKYKIHRFQHIYAMFLYGLTTIFWVFYRDFKKYFSGKLAEHTALQSMTLEDHIVFWISKAAHVGVFVIIPIYVVGFWPAFLGYLFAMYLLGLLLAIVFQLAHVVEHTDFVSPAYPDPERIDSEWAVHQIKTTANFATRSKTLSWLLGGLNFQVEHHVFPKVSHVHYPQINKLLMETCKEHGIQYIEYPTMWQALKSHMVYLRNLGR